MGFESVVWRRRQNLGALLKLWRCPGRTNYMTVYKEMWCWKPFWNELLFCCCCCSTCFIFIYFLFIFSFIFISWRLIILQYCSCFCHTLTWISREFTCVPQPEPPSHLPPHPIPLGHPSAPVLSTCLMHPTWTGDLFLYPQGSSHLVFPFENL